VSEGVGSGELSDEGVAVRAGVGVHLHRVHRERDEAAAAETAERIICPRQIVDFQIVTCNLLFYPKLCNLMLRG
jgi:hypothetical protein